MSKSLSSFDEWLTEVCLDLYDEVTAALAEWQAALMVELEKAKQEFLNG